MSPLILRIAGKLKTGPAREVMTGEGRNAAARVVFVHQSGDQGINNIRPRR